MSIIEATPFFCELSDSTYETINYAIIGIGLFTRSLTVLFIVMSMKYFIEGFAWSIQNWRRFIALLLMISLIIIWNKVNNYIDSILIILLWMKNLPQTFILDPLYTIIKWMITSWDDLSNFNDFNTPKFL
jgi:hypothetical protein